MENNVHILCFYDFRILGFKSDQVSHPDCPVALPETPDKLQRRLNNLNLAELPQ